MNHSALERVSLFMMKVLTPGNLYWLAVKSRNVAEQKWINFMN